MRDKAVWVDESGCIGCRFAVLVSRFTIGRREPSTLLGAVSFLLQLANARSPGLSLVG